jgi:two-component system, OmpR family, response regulator MprA
VSRSRLVVFLIDYDEDERVTHETILRTEGYELLGAADGSRALELLREQSPALIIVGKKIGSLTPEQLIRMIKTDETLSAVPVLSCTPPHEMTLRDDLLRAGADAVIAAPASPRELVRGVVALIGRA